jgi:hypothetical protein
MLQNMMAQPIAKTDLKKEFLGTATVKYLRRLHLLNTYWSCFKTRPPGMRLLITAVLPSNTIWHWSIYVIYYLLEVGPTIFA